LLSSALRREKNVESGNDPHTPVWRRGGSVEALQRVLRLTLSSDRGLPTPVAT